MPWKFRHVLHKDGDQLDRDHVNQEELYKSLWPKEHSTYNKTQESLGHILSRNCLLKHVIEVKREGKMRIKM